MKTMNDLVMELLQRDDEAACMQDLIVDIKCIVESHYFSDAAKLKFIHAGLMSWQNAAENGAKCMKNVQK